MWTVTRAIADWYDAVELWVTQLAFGFQVVLAVLVVCLPWQLDLPVLHVVVTALLLAVGAAAGGHLLDFTNKALELLDRIGWEHAPRVLPALTSQLVSARANPYRRAVSRASSSLMSATDTRRTGGSPAENTVPADRYPWACARPAMPAPMTATMVPVSSW